MTIHFEGSSIEPIPGETLLEAIERCGGSLPAFCRQGVCQACMVRAKRGPVPAGAQKGLKDGLRRQGMLLACLCQPTEDLEIERCGSAERHATHIESVEALSERVLRVRLAAPPGLVFQAGQFVQLERASDGLMRPYSIASLPGEPIELHVAVLPGGAMSQWFLGDVVGAEVLLRGPFGECFHLPDELERPLCLAGTGTGLAPLLGVVRAALAAGHRGPIQLFHGSVRRDGLYSWGELRSLVQRAERLRVTGSVLEPELEGGAPAADDERAEIRVGSLEEALPRALSGEERVYLCGQHELVRKLQRKAYLAGIPLARIHTDPFVAPGARP